MKKKAERYWKKALATLLAGVFMVTGILTENIVRVQAGAEGESEAGNSEEIKAFVEEISYSYFDEKGNNLTKSYLPENSGTWNFINEKTNKHTAYFNSVKEGETPVITLTFADGTDMGTLILNGEALQQGMDVTLSETGISYSVNGTTLEMKGVKSGEQMSVTDKDDSCLFRFGWEIDSDEPEAVVKSQDGSREYQCKDLSGEDIVNYIQTETTAVDVRIYVSDDASGIKEVTMVNSDNTEINLGEVRSDEAGQYYTVSLGDGQYTLNVTDNAGNRKEMKYEFKMDGEAPEIRGVTVKTGEGNQCHMEDSKCYMEGETAEMRIEISDDVAVGEVKVTYKALNGEDIEQSQEVVKKEENAYYSVEIRPGNSYKIVASDKSGRTAEKTYEICKMERARVTGIETKRENNEQVDLSNKGTYRIEKDVTLTFSTEGTWQTEYIYYSNSETTPGLDSNNKIEVADNGPVSLAIEVNKVSEDGTAYYFWAWNEKSGFSQTPYKVTFIQDMDDVTVINQGVLNSIGERELSFQLDNTTEGTTVKYGEEILTADGGKYTIEEKTDDDWENGITISVIKDTINQVKHELTLFPGIITVTCLDWYNGKEGKSPSFTVGDLGSERVLEVTYKITEAGSDKVIKGPLPAQQQEQQKDYIIPWNEKKNDKEYELPDGTYNVTVTAHFNRNKTRSCTFPLNIDRTAPEFEMNSINGGNYIPAGSLSEDSIKIFNVIEDNSGIAENGITYEVIKKDTNTSLLTFQLGPDETEGYIKYQQVESGKYDSCLNLKKYLEDKPKSLVDGTYTVRCTVTDNAGNVTSQEQELKLLSAQTKFQLNGDDFKKWYNVKVNSTRLVISGIKTGDDHVTVGKISVKIENKTGNKTFVYPAGNGENQDGTNLVYDEENKTCTLDLAAIGRLEDSPVVEGENTVTVRVENSAYNADNNNYKEYYQETEVVLKEDHTAPELKISGSDGSWTNSKEVNLTADKTDNLCAEDKIKVYYCLTAKDETPDYEKKDEFKGDIKPENTGEYDVHFWAVDEAGNKSACQTITLKFDFETPGVEPVGNWIKNASYISENTYWYSDNTDIQYKIENTPSGLDSGTTKENTGYVSPSDKIDNKLVKLVRLNDKDTIITATTNTGGGKEEKWNFSYKVYNNVGTYKDGGISVGIDRKAPEISDVTIGGTEVLNTHYSNSGIPIELTVTDGGAGVEKVELLDQNKHKVGTFHRISDGKYEFTLKATEKEISCENYQIRSTDNVGNTRTKTLDTMVITKGNIQINPVYEKKNQYWYKKDTTVTFHVNSSKAGIASVDIECNGRKMDIKTAFQKETKNGNGLVTSRTYSVSTRNIEPNEDNSYIFEMTVSDNAGNQKDERAVVYKDTGKPVITYIKFGQGDNEETGHVIRKHYGYFFREDTTVAVRAIDAKNESGISEIAFYTVRPDGTKSPKQIKTVKKGVAVFTVEKGFKGYLCAYATDKVGNQSKILSDIGTVIEDADMHEKYSGISFQKADTAKKDKNNIDLYHSDVPVTITAKDHFSGIQKVEWSVTSDDPDVKNIVESVQVDNKGNLTGNTDNTKSRKGDVNLVTSLSKTINVNHNSNHIQIRVVITDNAGNKSSKTQKLSIDKTAPEVYVEYDNNQPDNENTTMFHQNRTATIRIVERNFRREDVKLTVTNAKRRVPVNAEWKENESGANGDASVHSIRIPYTQDGDYEFDISYTDMAGNVGTVKYGSGIADAVAPQSFVIDKTNPVLSIAYDNNNGVNGNYYQDQRTAVITVVEHNFSADRFQITLRKNGENFAPALEAWNHQGDTHTAALQLQGEAEYQLTAEYTDMAGNRAVDEINESFIIDTKEPELKISGVENNQAYEQEILPVTVSAADTYFDDLQVILTRTDNKGQSVTIPMTEDTVENGAVYSLDNIEEDGIYTLHCTATDKSGRSSTKEVVFSVNRTGSTYIMDEYALKVNGKAEKSVTEDIMLTEVNVSQMDLKKLSVIMYYGSQAISLQEGKDYKVEEKIENGMWSTYVYTIFRTNFAKDGAYSISITSSDLNQRVNSNEDEGKAAGIAFTVDATAPICSVDDLTDDKMYALSEKDVAFHVMDNIELQSVTVILNGKELYTLKGEDLTEENMKFTIAESSGEQRVIIRCMDTAGNESETVIEGFLVTTSLAVRFTHSTLLIWIAVTVLFFVLICVIVLITKKRKKKEMA